MKSNFKDTYGVFRYMQQNIRETTFRGEPQRYLRKTAFDEITTKETILLVANEDEDLYFTDEEMEAFVDKVFDCGRKLFATCIQGSLSLACLQLLLKNGLTDANIPLTEEDFPGQRMKRNFVGSFIPNQALFNTAFFALDSIQDINGLTKPISHDGSDLIGRGAFGAVYSIRIPEDHRSFVSGNTKDEFAMKVTEQKGTRELPYHQAMAGHFHPHLVKCLASFTFALQYHMIYEKADRNLEEFMQKHRDASTLPSLSAQGLSQQIAGLVGAVSVIHNQSSDGNTNRLSVHQPDRRMSGYLHDIKPDNILVFKYHQQEQGYHFRLSDFSCAKVVAFVQSVSGRDRESWQSSSRIGTPIYRAPEHTTKGKTSRPYDIWSLGCVLLEILVWFTEGYKALETFRESRFRAVRPNGLEDQGFYYIEGSSTNARVREQVLDKIESIPTRCEGPLRVIADTISEMLNIDPKKRPTAEQLVARFKVCGQAPQPPNMLHSTDQPDTRIVKPSLPLHPTYTSDSDSDIGPIVKIQVPTDE